MKKVVATAFPDPLLTGALAFGKAVRAARTTSGMTQADAALVIGISKQTLLDIESGTGTVGLALSLRTAHELGVSLFAVPSKDREVLRRMIHQHDESELKPSLLPR